jgi:hypothetical protein
MAGLNHRLGGGLPDPGQGEAAGKNKGDHAHVLVLL